MLIKPIYLFGIEAQIQNTVGAASYGDYFSLFTFVYLFQVILDMGIQNYNSVYLSGNREKFEDQIRYTLGTKLILSIVFTIVVSIVATTISYPDRFYSLLPWIIGSQILMSFYLYFRSHFSAMGHYKVDTFFSAFDKTLMIICFGYLMYVQQLEMNILQFAKGHFTICAIALIVCAGAVKYRYRFISIRFSFADMRRILKKSYPFALVLLFMSLYTRMDGVMLERMIDDDSYAAGVYAAGFRIYDAINIIGYLFAGLLLPMFSNLLSKKESTQSLVENALVLIMSIGAGISIISIFYRKEIIDLIYTNTNGMYYDSFLWLMLSFFFICIGYIYGTLITASGNLKQFNLIFVGGIIINWTLNLILIPRLLSEGAAIATFITQSTVVIAQIYLAFKRNKLRVDFTKIGQFILLVLILILGVFFIKTYLAHHWLYTICISAILCGLTPFFIGFIRWNILLDLIKLKSGTKQ